eukprot:TRINITY_DN56672_c0_g1_i1.p3 TRINITY_DN56672_c0_g1~~TRINITY_DN56672_c0_g1_i1.p3  ORF type:complete len:107 (+),score=0.82 TRINITY_DN56672_c0_g1_i1:201-521(+)
MTTRVNSDVPPGSSSVAPHLAQGGQNEAGAANPGCNCPPQQCQCDTSRPGDACTSRGMSNAERPTVNAGRTADNDPGLRGSEAAGAPPGGSGSSQHTAAGRSDRLR